MNNHTPGPWEIKGFIIVKGEQIVATAIKDEDLKFISAAPDLLAALEKILEGNTMAGRENWTLHDVIQEHYKIARQAIAKAKGV